MVVIIDYGIGNLTSIKNMLKKAGESNVSISDNHHDIKAAEKLILPGVGHFDYGMQQLQSSGLLDILNHCVLEDKTPILGICLGAQLLTKGSEEGSESGLGWVDAHTVRFRGESMNQPLKVPHMGWSDITIKKESRLFEGMPNESRFYFVHSYHIRCEHPTDELVSANYGYEFTAGVEHDNIIGVQFHPEKSHKFGLKLLSNFINNY